MSLKIACTPEEFMTKDREIFRAGGTSEQMVASMLIWLESRIQEEDGITEIAKVTKEPATGRAELARVKTERDDLRERIIKYEISDVGFDGIRPERLTSSNIYDDRRITRSEVADTLRLYESELAVPQQRDVVPVKVRWDVTAEALDTEYQNRYTPYECHWARFALDYLAAHAVIDVPAGAPSVDELTELIYSHVRTGRNYATSEDEFKAAATAIRDAVLRGLGASAAPTDEPEWKNKVKAAHDMVSALCKPRGSNGSEQRGARALRDCAHPNE